MLVQSSDNNLLLIAMMLNNSETIPLIDGQLALGKWQSVLFFELDGSRDRHILKY